MTEPAADLTGYRVRAYRNSDWAFIRAKWVESSRWTDEAKAMGASYPLAKAAVIKHLVARPGVITRVMCDADSPEVLWGFSSFGGDVLHYVYLKDEARGFGLSRQLVDVSRLTYCSHPYRGLEYRPEKAW